MPTALLPHAIFVPLAGGSPARAGPVRGSGALVISFVAAWLSASAAHAEILIGTAVPLLADFQGEQILRGVEMAVADINGAGGLLGDEVRLIAIDDNCDAEQGLAAARALAAENVVFVAGHLCSDASLAAAPVYDAAGIVMISPASTNPRLTEEGRATVFRVVGRDDAQGAVAAARLAREWGTGRIAVLAENTSYGDGLASQTRQELSRLGTPEFLFKVYETGGNDYSALVGELAEARPDVVYFGGNYPEIALIARQARARGIDAPFVAGDAIATEVFWEIAGKAAEGTAFTFFPDPRLDPANAELVERFRETGVEPEGYTFFGYAAVQVWASAVAQTGSVEAAQVAEGLRAASFDTVLGSIGFDAKGDLIDNAFVWYAWRDGAYSPDPEGDPRGDPRGDQ